MARIVTALSSLAHSHNELVSELPDIAAICRARNYTYRDRLLTPAITLQLFCLQVLYANTAITHLRQLTGIHFASSSYSDARKRIPLNIFQDILEHQTMNLMNYFYNQTPLVAPSRRLLVVDAVTFSMPDTKKLRSHFGFPTGQKEGVGYPVGKAMALLDYNTGMFIRLLPVPLFTHDMRGVMRLHPDSKKGDILLGDTAFCSFAHFCLLRERGVDGVFHLHQRRPKEAGVKRWERPQQIPAWMTAEQFNTLPEYMDIRVVKHTVAEKGFRTKEIFIATTLMDEEEWPDEAIADLYLKRWNIEVCFKHLKTTMKMEVLKCKSVEGVQKELAVYLMVYNAARRAMLEAAKQQGIEDAWRISFIDAVRWISARLMGLPGVEKLIVNPFRPGRFDPRVRRRRPKTYPLMMEPREVLKKAIFAA